MRNSENSFFSSLKSKRGNMTYKKLYKFILPLFSIILMSVFILTGVGVNFAVTASASTASYNSTMLSANNPTFFNFFKSEKEEKPASTENISVYAGGYPVGFILQGRGVTVVGMTEVETKEGIKNTIVSSDIKAGDIITKIAGSEVLSSEHIAEIINSTENAGKELSVNLTRGTKQIETKITPALEIQSGKYKIGLWVRDDMSGVGTLTFVRVDTKRFGALGHPVCDTDSGNIYDVRNGDMYASNIISVTKGKKGKAGELKGMFLQGKNVQGTVDKNGKLGVYGVVTEESPYFIEENIISVGSRKDVKIGKAQIIACVDGKEPKRYDIEIVKLNSQNKSASKGLVIKVTDKELLSKTGGIVQGMSGSPIIQNGKLVGAVTYVFVNDPTRGYGIYIDWMIDK